MAIFFRKAGLAPPSNPRPYLRLSIKLILALAILWLLNRYGYLDLASLANAWSHPWLVALGVLLAIATQAIASFRWHLLIRAQNVHIPWSSVLGITFAANFSNNFLPGIIGGDAVRSAYLVAWSRQGRSGALLSIIMDRYLGVLGMAWTGALAAVWRWSLFSNQGVLRAVALSLLGVSIGGLLALCLGLLFASRLLRHASKAGWEGGSFVKQTGYKLVLALDRYRGRPLVLAANLSLALLGWIGIIGTVVAAAGTLNLGKLAAVDYAIATPAAAFASMIPATPGGIGFGEGAFAQMLLLLGAGQKAEGYASVFLTFRAMSMVASLPGVASYFLLKSPGRRD